MRQVEHKEMRQMKDDLVNNYSVSPLKIRKAGLEEMQSLQHEQQQLEQSRNSS